MKRATPRTKHARRLRIELYPYQRRWVEDESRFKIACKARQIGFTFAAAYRVVRKRVNVPGLTLWISASERQALEAMEHIRHHIAALEAVAAYEEDFLEGSLLKQHTVRLRNGSRIVALPANPDTVRGFAGDVVLDEFAFHRDADSIWRAAFATATRGFQLEVVSTPNGARGKYYELARAAGLVDFEPTEKSRSLAALGMTAGRVGAHGKYYALAKAAGLVDRGPSAPVAARNPAARDSSSAFSRPTDEVPRTRDFVAATGHEPRVTGHESPVTVFSPHWVDLASARTQGFVVDVESLRAALADEDAWQQEYCCRFLSDAAHYLPPELVVAAEHPAATTTAFFLPATGASLVIPSAARNLHFEMQTPRQARGDRLEPPNGFHYLGVDIGRRRDLTVLWLLEAEDAPTPVYWTRGILVLDRQPFAAQRQALDSLLARREQDLKSQISDLQSFLVRRCAVDATGIGAMLAEELRSKWGARVEPVTFTRAVKEALAMRVKRLLEEGRLRLPADPAVRAALGSVKRYVTPAGHARFDADRTEQAGHADHFWALALALGAAEEPALSLEFVSTSVPRSFAQAAVF